MDTIPPIIAGFSPTSVVVADLKITSDVMNDDAINSNGTGNGVVSTAIAGILANPYRVFATWEAVFDLESEIKSAAICASTTKEECNLALWKAVDPSSTTVSLDFPNPLKTGTVFILKMKVENGAGLESIEYSDNIIVDDTAPSKGVVRVGKTRDLAFIQEGEPLSASWASFADPESTIKMYQWRICLTSEASSCVSEFVSVGLKTSLVLNDLGIDHGIEYNLVIKVINFAELEVTAVSNPFILDKTSPESGMVFDGDVYLKDKAFQSSSLDISVSWKGFQDKESGIARYEVCVGSKSGLCDVSEFKNFNLATKARISNLNLTHNDTYYTTVRAVNGAGQTSFSTSNGIRVDLTSPEGDRLSDGDDFDIDVTIYDYYVNANWEEFTDPESGILKYVICAGSVKGSCDILPQTTVNNELEVKLQVNPVISSGTVVYATLRVHNNAGGITEIYSDGVLVDSTPPESGKVSLSISYCKCPLRKIIVHNFIFVKCLWTP